MLFIAVIDIHITLVTFFLKLKSEQSKQVKKLLQNKWITSNTYDLLCGFVFFSNTEEPKVIQL